MAGARRNCRCSARVSSPIRFRTRRRHPSSPTRSPNRTPPAGNPRTPTPRREHLPSIPRHNVVLEASAGTGKTSVLVARYINLLKAGVDPANILAITFTRKASAEMRERIVRELRESAARSEFDKARWVELRDRLGRSRSARSTRSVCHSFVSSRSRPISILASRWRTRPKCRGSSKSRWTARCGSSRAWRKTMPTWRSCSRSLA